MATCGRPCTILKRHVSTCPHYEEPDWLSQNKHAAALSGRVRTTPEENVAAALSARADGPAQLLAVMDPSDSYYEKVRATVEDPDGVQKLWDCRASHGAQ